MTEVPSSVEFSRAIRRVGIAPRIILRFITLLTVIAAMLGANGLPMVAQIFLAGPPLLGFVLSWRIRLKVSPEALTVRSYFSTTTMSFPDIVAVDDVGYEGFWSRYDRSPDGWLGMGARMLEVGSKGGREKSFPATLCGPKTARVLSAELTRRAQSGA